MQTISSTQAKQTFGTLLEDASRGPVAIEKHQKIKAIMASPAYYAAAGAQATRLSERQAARAAQVLVERERLIKHQRIAIELLTAPAPVRKALIRRALAEVERWRADGLCSADYIERWQAWLQLPVGELAKAMACDAEGWGPALRQNSPWAGVLP